MLNVTSMIGGGAGISAVGFPSISGERFRYRADLGITKDGSDLVSAWADQSGNDDHLANPTANKPLWVDNQVNGYPIVRFNGVGGASGGGSLLQVVGDACGAVKTHYFVVIKQLAWTVYQQPLSWGMAGYDNNFVQVGSTPQLVGDGGASVNHISPTIGTFFLVSSFYDGSTGSYMSLNDDSIVTGGSVISPVRAYTHFTLGGAKLLNYSANVEFAEVVVYDGVKVEGSNLTKLKAYFNARYALY